MEAIQNPIISGLTDVCAEAFGFVIRLHSSETQDDRDALRTEAGDVLNRLKVRGRHERVDADAIEQASFAIVALIDEIAMTSNWTISPEWAREPLQLTMFRTTSGGDEFFERVDELRKGNHPDRAAILEIYATCVALGFRGKYGTLDGMERLRGLLGNLIDDARGGKGSPRTLSPAVKPDRAADSDPRLIPNWLFPLLAAALVIVVAAVSWSWIDSDLQTLVDELNK